MNTIDIVGKGTLPIDASSCWFNSYEILPAHKLPDDGDEYDLNEEAVKNIVYYAPRMYDFLRKLSDKGMLPSSMEKSFGYIRDTIEGELDG